MFDFTGPYCTTIVHWSNVYICTVCVQNNLQRISSSPWHAKGSRGQWNVAAPCEKSLVFTVKVPEEAAHWPRWHDSSDATFTWNCIQLQSAFLFFFLFFLEQTIFCEIQKNAVQDNSWFLLGFSGRRHDGEPNCAKYQWHTNDEGVQVNSRSFRRDYATADLRVRRASVSRLHISCVAQRQKVWRQVNKRVNTNRPLGVHPFFRFLLSPPFPAKHGRGKSKTMQRGLLDH